MNITPTPGSGWQTPVSTPGPAAGLHFAHHGARLLSYLLDTLLLSFLSLALFFLALTLGVFGLLIAFPALILLGLGYFPYFRTHGGQTPGMRPFGLRVVMDRDGGPLSVGPAILRLVGYWINGFVFDLGFAWVLIDARHRGWHDLIAGSVVVQSD